MADVPFQDNPFAAWSWLNQPPPVPYIGPVTAADIAAAAAGAAGVAPPSAVGPDVVVPPPSPAPVIELPPAAPTPQLPPPIYSDVGASGYGAFGAMFSPFGPLYRRSTRLTRAGQQVRGLVKIGLDAVRGEVSALTRSFTSRAIAREAIVTAGGKLPPGLLGRAAGLAGQFMRASGNPYVIGLALLLKPTATASNDILERRGFNEDLWRDFDAWNADLEAGRRIYEQQPEMMDRPESLRVAPGPRPRNFVERAEDFLENLPVGRMLNAPGWVPNLRKLISEGASAPGSQTVTPAVVPPYVNPTRAPLPGEVQQGPTPPAPKRGKRIAGVSTGLGRMPWPVVGVLGGVVATAIIRRQQGGGSPAGSPIASGPTIGLPPAPTVSPIQSPLLVGGYGGSFGGSTAFCEPRARGPRRKCLERAPVAWRSGRNKGKAAGTKCVRRAARAT